MFFILLTINKYTNTLNKSIYLYFFNKKNMGWKQTSIIAVSILLVGMFLGYLITHNINENKTINQKIIDGEKKIIDSLFKELKLFFDLDPDEVIALNFEDFLFVKLMISNLSSIGGNEIINSSFVFFLIPLNLISPPISIK